MGRALDDYAMLQDGDRVAVGLSGGKDSWGLLWLLSDIRKRAPIDFQLIPIFIDPGFDGGPGKTIERQCNAMGFALHVDVTDHGRVAHSEANRENPCFLCSRLRRKRLFQIADGYGCRKLALAHHKDDLIETLLLNMCYAGEISTMVPRQPFFEGRFEVIRPLAYAGEEDLNRFSQQMQWPVSQNPCPSAGKSKRAEIKQLLQQLYNSNSKVKGNIFGSMRHVKPEYLLK
jgi:tRNA 2-thiocytidine biosynthesis protein TtcA